MPSSIRNSLRLAAKSLRRNKRATAWMGGIFAVATWANIVVWCIGLPVVVEPLPYRDADRIVRIWQAKISAPGDRSNAAYGNLLLWRDRAQAAAVIGGYAIPPRPLILESAQSGTFERLRTAI